MGRKILIVLLVLVLALAGFLLYVDYSLKREPAIPASGERPADGPGTNWLLVGSDSREGLDADRQAELGTGDTGGRRTDTVMLVHIPQSGGKPTMVSLPRDSYVTIPGRGKDKLNSAFAYGGPQLLAQTVEASTGVRVDHYAEIGLGGFADMTDAIGGVDVCVKEPMQDPKANLDVQAGCQELTGPQALGYVRAQAERATQRVHALQMDVLKLAQAHERYTQRSTQIREELEEIGAQIEEQRALRAESEANFERFDGELAELQARFEDNQLAFESLDESLTQARQAARDLERTANDARFAARNAATRIDELKRSIQVAHEQSERVAASLEDARAELETINEQTAQTGLHDALEIRAARDEALAAARIELDDLTAKLRASDDARLVAERSLQPLRDRITELQLKEQAARLSAEQFAEQLAAAEVDEAALREKLTPDLKPSYLQGEVTRINNAVAALGPVNMAALEELKAASERKVFLDAQSADLTDAITTLEDAIHKIDQETRTLLQGTFDEVNRHFSDLFPRLFGGGQAKLIMTGDEILDAGVQVMAQPPGKKNATIHLLSGGEKALTATALVFAMFQLNPAPFCLLDEVDAPLDDANTERFANLVRAMSDKTQFLFISHNKIAMEMAQQLIGVTMQEQGVSRIVAVDMETAAGFAQN